MDIPNSAGIKRRLAMLILVTLVSSVVVMPLQAQPAFKAAAGKVVVTPPDGSFMAGYGRNRRATGIYDELYIKGAAVAVGQEVLILLTIDSIGLTRPDILQIQAGVAARQIEARVVVSSTHTHAGPDVVGLWGPRLWRSGRDEAYMGQLVSAAVTLSQQLVQQLQPASSRVVSADVPLPWVENRSEPGLLDTRLAVLQFLDASGRSIVTLTNYACHPTVLDGANTMISADYAAGFYAAMSAQLPGEHLFLQGAIGGWVQPIPAEGSYARAQQLGASLAGAALQSLAQAQPNRAAALAYQQRTVDIDLANWGFRLMMWLGVLDRDTHDGAMRTSVATFRLGDAVFITHPGETSPAYSFASRALAPTEHTFVLGLTQDAIGYILKPDYFADDAAYPHAQYLTSVSVGPAAGPLIMSALQDMLGDTAAVADPGD